MLEVQKWLINLWEWERANIDLPLFVWGVIIGVFLAWWVRASWGRSRKSKALLFVIGFFVVFMLPFLYLLLYVCKVIQLFAGGNALDIFKSALYKGFRDEKDS